MVYINNLKPRKNNIISNNYFIVNNFQVDFHNVIYYLSKNKCKIILRRLDKEEGWNNNILINIDNEIISVGSSIYNHKIVNINTKTDLFFKSNDYEQKIPKIIIQTFGSNNISHLLHINSILTFQELNPEYEYVFFNNSDCRNFIKNNFNEDTLYYYDILVAGAFKADFFRYCFIYINGGCYFDCKQILKCPLSSIIKNDSELFLCQDIHKTGLFNAVLISCPKNNLFLKAIETIKYKIQNFTKIYSHLSNTKKWAINNTILSLTGPSLLYDVAIDNIDFNKYVTFKHIKKSEDYNDLYIEYNNRKIIVKNYINSKGCGTHYSVLWKNNEILYKNYIKLNEFSIFIYPSLQNDIFDFYLLPDKKLLAFNKTNIFWKNHFKIKIIDNNNHNEYFVNINNSNNRFLIINTSIDFHINNLLIDYTILNDIYKDNQINKKIFDIYIIQHNEKFYFILLNNLDNLNNIK
jgi:mannosyltransferase OCH1-like enzyme